ncbi:MAG: sialate O-acetylesterase [bacterium]|nr:sialate O-acetylesterase [bacterium]
MLTRLLFVASIVGLFAAFGSCQEPDPKCLQVWVLCGQSNMQGHAKIATLDHLADDPATRPLLQRLRDRDGKPRVADKVWVSYLTGGRGGEGEGVGRLTAGFGARTVATEPGDKIGPEWTFGLTVSAATSQPVLLIKTAWGGKSLHTDFRPPSAGPYVFGKAQRERLEQQGKFEAAEKSKVEATGVYYRKMLAHVRRVLTDPGRVCDAYDEKAGFELAGFVWFQGWNDLVDRGTYPERGKPGGYDAYSECLVHFIRDVRRDLEAPKLPFVIGVMGVGGKLKDGARYTAIHRSFRDAMAAPASLPEFRGNVAAVRTALYWDAKLQRISELLEQVRGMSRKLRSRAKDGPNADGKMDAAAQKAWLTQYRDEVVGPESEAIWRRGASNAAFHYLGSAKILTRIGHAFGEAALELQSR